VLRRFGTVGWAIPHTSYCLNDGAAAPVLGAAFGLGLCGNARQRQRRISPGAVAGKSNPFLEESAGKQTKKQVVPGLCQDVVANRHADCPLQSRKVSGSHLLTHLIEEVHRDRDH
jgi:hypothetical protein